jgi:hypothetical protein
MPKTEEREKESPPSSKCGSALYISNDAVFMRKITDVKRSNRSLYGPHVLIRTKWRHVLFSE